MEHPTVKDIRCFSTTSGSLVAPNGFAESLASVAKFSVSPISPPFSGHSCSSSLELENRHVRSTGDEPQALNLLERALHLTQGQMVASYVIMESIAWNRVSISISLCPKKGQSRDRKNTVTVGCWHSCATNLQRYILDRSPARPGPP